MLFIKQIDTEVVAPGEKGKEVAPPLDKGKEVVPALEDDAVV